VDWTGVHIPFRFQSLFARINGQHMGNAPNMQSRINGLHLITGYINRCSEFVSFTSIRGPCDRARCPTL
jgi:hypothetical protein